MTDVIPPESPLVNHSKYADWRVLCNKVLSFCHRGSAIIADDLSEARLFSSAFETAKEDRRLAVGLHPSLRHAIGELLTARKLGTVPTVAKAERLASVVKEAAEALVGSTPAAPYGGPESPTLGGDIQIWTEDWNHSASGAAFAELFEQEVATTVSSQRASLVTPTARQGEALETGFQLLMRLQPNLAASALRHVRTIAIIDYSDPSRRQGRVRSDLCQNVSTHRIPGTIFLSPSPLRSPFHTAEAILHEALHKKLSDLVLTESVFQPGYLSNGATEIPAIWNNDLSWNSNLWPADRALFALHVYAYLYHFFSAASENHSSDFGINARAIEQLASSAQQRARYLARELIVSCSDELGPTGRDLVAWLSNQVPECPFSPDILLYMDRYDRETREVYRALSAERFSRTNEGNWDREAEYEDWPFNRTAHHLVHSEVVALYRVLSTLGSDEPSFPFYDGDWWSSSLVTQLSTQELAEAFRSIRAITSATLRAHGPGNESLGFKTRRHRVLLDLVRDIVEHAGRHNDQLLQ